MIAPIIPVKVITKIQTILSLSFLNFLCAQSMSIQIQNTNNKTPTIMTERNKNATTGKASASYTIEEQGRGIF